MFPLIKNRNHLGASSRFSGEPNLDALPAACKKRKCWVANRLEFFNDAEQSLVEAALAFAPGSQHSARDDRDRTRTHKQIGQNGALEHFVELVGHARNCVNDLVANWANQAWCSTPALLDDVGTFRHHCLAHVDLGHASIARRKHFRNGHANFVIKFQLHAHNFGDCLARDVVVRWPKPTADDYCIGVFECLANGFDHSIEVVANLYLQARIDACCGKLLAQPRRIGINYLTK